MVTVQSEIGGPEILGSAMGPQTPAEVGPLPQSAGFSLVIVAERDMRVPARALSSTHNAHFSRGYGSPDLPGELLPKLGSLAYRPRIIPLSWFV